MGWGGLRTWVGMRHQKGSNFQSLSGTGHIPLYKLWEGAQIYLSGKGLLSYLCLELEYHKYISVSNLCQWCSE